MDGPVIQQASQYALEQGVTPAAILDEVPSLDVDIPLAVMTYYNLVHHPGVARFAADLRRAGICAAILPDLPLEESGPWCAAADAEGIETIMLAAPTAPDERLPRVAARVAGSSTRSACSASPASVTSLAATATALAGRLKAITDVPVLVGVGVSDAAQAYEAIAGRRRCDPGRERRAPTDGARPRRGRRLRRRGPRRHRRRLTPPIATR